MPSIVLSRMLWTLPSNSRRQSPQCKSRPSVVSSNSRHPRWPSLVTKSIRSSTNKNRWRFMVLSPLAIRNFCKPRSLIAMIQTRLIHSFQDASVCLMTGCFWLEELLISIALLPPNRQLSLSKTQWPEKDQNKIELLCTNQELHLELPFIQTSLKSL